MLDGVLVFLLLVFAFLVASFRAGNSDAFLHLAAGRAVASGQWPAEDLYAYTDALYAQSPGDTVAVVVLRGTERVTVKVTLGRRN